MLIRAVASPLKKAIRATIGDDHYLNLVGYVKSRLGKLPNARSGKQHRVVIYYVKDDLTSLADSNYMREWFTLALVDCRVQIMFGNGSPDGKHIELQEELAGIVANDNACRAFTKLDAGQGPNCCGPICAKMLKLDKVAVFVAVPEGNELRRNLSVLSPFIEAQYPKMLP